MNPWLFIGAAILLLLLWVLMTVPLTPTGVLGHTFFAFAAFCICGTVALWRVAFDESFAHLLVSLFFPPLYLVYSLFTNGRKTLVPFALYATGTVVFAAGFGNALMKSDRLDVRVMRQRWGLGNEAHCDPNAPYDLSLCAPLRPKFDESEFKKKTDRGVDVYTHSNPRPKGSPKRRPSRPGEQMEYVVYLPSGAHPERSLGCVLVAPCGTNLLSGSRVDKVPRNPEHMPYVNKGYAVVTFSLDGWVDDVGKATDDDVGWASFEFQFAHAGLVNAKAAYDFAATQIPAVDPRRIYIAGHNSAGTLALLFAEHEPGLAGCIAYAPVTDVEAHLRLALETVQKLDPGGAKLLQAFATRSSPKTHAARLACAAFIYHAAGDTEVSVASTRIFCDELRAARKDLTYVEGAGTDHAQTALSEGIPAALKWLAGRPGSPPEKPDLIAANHTGDFNSLPEIQPPAHPAPRIDTPQPDLSPLRRSRKPSSPAGPSAAVSPAPTGSRRADAPRAPAATAPDSTAASPSSESRSPPAGTRPVNSAADLSVGMRVIAFRGNRWVGAEVVAIRAPDQAKLHYLKLPDAFDRLQPLSELHIPLAAHELPDGLVATLSFEIIRFTGDGTPNPAAVEQGLLELEGYIPGTSKLDATAKVATLQVIRGRRAEKDAHIAFHRGKVFVRNRPVNRNRVP